MYLAYTLPMANGYSVHVPRLSCIFPLVYFVPVPPLSSLCPSFTLSVPQCHVPPNPVYAYTLYRVHFSPNLSINFGNPAP
jgi:hypothetical protein